MRRPLKIQTRPLVNTPVRSGAISASRSSDNTRKLLESRFDIEGVPEDDDVHHEAQRAELVFLPLSITLAEFTPLAMKDRPRQLVSVLAKIARAKVPAAKREQLRSAEKEDVTYSLAEDTYQC